MRAGAWRTAEDPEDGLQQPGAAEGHAGCHAGPGGRRRRAPGGAAAAGPTGGGLRVRRAGRDIALTAREFAVLVTLADRAGTPVRKIDILDAAWDDPGDADLNLVEVHVSALRRKIDKPFGRAAVETVRGTGYRLRPDGG